MTRAFLMALALLLPPTSLVAQDTRQRTVDQNQMAFVSKEVQLIEVDSLPMDPSMDPTNKPTAAARGAFAVDGKPGDNGLRMFRFMLAPGEKLTTRILSDLGDLVTQRLGMLSGPEFQPSTASKAQIARINRLSRQQRTSKIEFMNVEDRPFPLLLIVYGQVGHPFRIQVSRN